MIEPFDIVAICATILIFSILGIRVLQEQKREREAVEKIVYETEREQGESKPKPEAKKEESSPETKKKTYLSTDLIDEEKVPKI